MSNMQKSISNVLNSLVEIASTKKKLSFKKMAVTAGLDPSTDFRGASLCDLDLREEDLTGFDFSNADLTGSDFRRAKINRTVFTGANLKGTVGIDSINDFTIVSFDKKYTTQIVKSNIINNVTPDKKLAGLVTELRFGKSKISDISKLEHVHNLKILSLASTRVENIDILNRLKNIEELTIDGTKIRDLSPISHLTELKYFSANKTSISHLSDIQNCQKLIYLSLQGTDVKDIKEVKLLKNLEEFTIESDYAIDLSPIIKCQFLNSLIVKTKNVKEIPNFDELKRLINFVVSTSSAQFPHINHDNRLRFLSVSSSSCIEIPDLRHLKRLSYLTLDLSHSQLGGDLLINEEIRNIKLLYINLNNMRIRSSLENVESLSLHNVYVGNFDFMKEMTNLKRLYLSQFDGEYDLYSLPLLPKLEYISLEGHENNYSGYSRLSYMPKLRKININSHTIVEAVVKRNLGLEIYYKDSGPMNLN